MTRTLIVAAAVCLCASCTTVPPRIVVAPPSKKDVLMIAPLDVRFTEVHFDHVPIQDAIDRIAADVRYKYGSAYFFSPSFESASQRIEAHISNPRVTFHGSDVSAREVFVSVCRQVGWSFEWTVKHNIRFLDAPGLREGTPQSLTKRGSSR